MPTAKKKSIARLGMVDWYDPRQLRSTAVEVLVSTIFGRHADKRLLQALADDGGLRKRYYYEVVNSKDAPFWLDYISDVGDGFNSTFTMAQILSRRDLPLKTKDQPCKVHETEQGDLLVFGGDEVYPVASHKAYKERLQLPYNAAFPRLTEAQERKDPTRKKPTVFAIPGNHDWYDSLVAFSERFFLKRKFCGWTTIQNRSYFAIKLPRGWWLFGTDMQLASSLDRAQMNYFEQVMKHVDRSDKIILCNAEPHWITEQMYADDPDQYNRNLGYFEGGILKGQVAIHIAGDRHYYRRHVMFKKDSTDIKDDDPSRVQKFVAGGGGAFLHPTHGEDVDFIGRDHKYKLASSYPDANTSRKLTKLNFQFFRWNKCFAVIIGFVYLLVAQAFYLDSRIFVWPDLVGSAAGILKAFITQPAAFISVVLISLGFWLFADSHSEKFRLRAGFVHASAHLLTIFLLSWIVALIFFGGEQAIDRSNVQVIGAGVTFLVSGTFLGSLVFGAYLFVSLNYFNKHHNDAFASLKIEDYKNFLRMKVEMSGDLIVYPIGVDSVVKDWMEDQTGDHLTFRPAKETPENAPYLIEEPVSYAKESSTTESSTSDDEIKDVEGVMIVERSLLD